MDLLRTKDVGSAAKAIESADPEILDRLNRVVPAAIHGDEGAVGDYVRAWRELAERFLTLATHQGSDFVVRTASGGVMIAELKESIPSAVLDYQAVGAPFSPWVNMLGAGKGIAVCILSSVRDALPGFLPLPHPPEEVAPPDWDLDRRNLWMFALRVLRHLQGGDPLLLRILDVFDLSRTEAARLFGVRRQAVAQWLDDGVPPARQARILRVAQIADLLERNLQRERIPAVARTPAAAYGDRSMLDMIAEGREAELLDITRNSFDWAVPA